MKEKVKNFMDFIQQLSFTPSLSENRYSDYIKACEQLEYCERYLNDEITLNTLIDELNIGCPYNEYSYYDEECYNRDDNHCLKCWMNMLNGKIKYKDMK